MFQDLQKFLREVWREVRPGKGLVTWPDFESVQRSTIVVILSTLALSFFISAVDLLLMKIRVFLLS